MVFTGKQVARFSKWPSLVIRTPHCELRWSVIPLVSGDIGRWGQNI